MDLDRKKCPQCEMEVLDTDLICPFCGKRLSASVSTPARRNARIGAILLLVIVGLPAALVGICSIAAGSGAATSGDGLGGIAVIVGLVAFVALGLTIWAVLNAWRK